MKPVSEWAGGRSGRGNPGSRSSCTNQKTTFLQSMALLNYRPERQCHATLFTFCKLVTSQVSSLGTDQICSLGGSLVSGFDDSCVSRHSVEGGLPFSDSELVLQGRLMWV